MGKIRCSCISSTFKSVYNNVFICPLAISHLFCSVFACSTCRQWNSRWRVEKLELEDILKVNTILYYCKQVKYITTGTFTNRIVYTVHHISITLLPCTTTFFVLLAYREYNFGITPIRTISSQSTCSNILLLL
jgi:hypothetical protein